MNIRFFRRRRVWLPLTFLVFALTAEIRGLQYFWTADTQTHPNLRNIYVQADHELHLENAVGSEDQILQYLGRAPHNHLVTLEMESGSLSQNTALQLASSNPLHTPGRLLYAPDRGNYTGKPCTVYFRAEFLKEAGSSRRSLTLYPPRTYDSTQAERSRSLYIRSGSPLLVRIGVDSEDGHSGPNCRSLATIGDWKQYFGPNSEAGFVATPDSPVTLTLSSVDPSGFTNGVNEVESFLELEALQPTRLFVTPMDVNRPEQVRIRAGSAVMKLSKLQLGSDFLQLELSGLIGLSISDFLGGWKIPPLVLINVPLLVWLGMTIRVKPHPRPFPPVPFPLPELSGNRIFLSYSRADRDRVMQIHDLLKAAGADPWIDEQDIAGGVDWELSIKRQMRNSAYVLIFLSRESTQKAGYVWAEMRMAAQIADEQPEGKSFVIPVRLEDCVLPAILSRWNCIDLHKAGGQEKLLRALGLHQANQPSDNVRAVQ